MGDVNGWLSKLTTFALIGLIGLFSVVGLKFKREMANLKAEQEAIRRELDVSNRLLQAMGRGSADPASALVNSPVAISGAPSRGEATAKVTMVEISDYVCPFCRRYVQETEPQIENEYIRPNRLRVVFLDYPIEQLHPDSHSAHEAANCAGEQGRYWDMHAELFAKPIGKPQDVMARATAAGVDMKEFRTCVQSGKYVSKVRDSVARIQRLGINATPTFLLGLTPADGQPMKILRVIPGAAPYDVFKEAFDAIATQ